MSKLSYETVRDAVAGSGAAFRCTLELQPAGGPGDKIFPPTYEGGNYATESRRLPGHEDAVNCVLLDSVASQANRMEVALLDAWEEGRLELPVLTVDFKDYDLPRPLRVTSLDAPHRIADALLRDCLHNGEPFRKSKVGSVLDIVSNGNATPLLEYCPTALIFGLWDSTGPRGGLGAKFARSLVSEIVGVKAVGGVKTSSRIDPAQIEKASATIYEAKDGGWTMDEQSAVTVKGKPKRYGKEGKPSEINHGNIAPSITPGGFTVERAFQTTVLSLAGLRRLKFPVGGKAATLTQNQAGRTVLAALGICAAALASEKGLDLRSRCFLIPTQVPEWELLAQPGQEPRRYQVESEGAIAILKRAVEDAKKAGLPWHEKEIELAPSPDLGELVKRSQLLALTAPESD
ncbi:MAG: type I-U CRISPR-associated RAMP protein Csb1/Cas7u [Vulcanimicrobiota bacterium]